MQPGVDSFCIFGSPGPGILYYTIQYYTTLYYTVLYYTIYYTILDYSPLFLPRCAQMWRVTPRGRAGVQKFTPTYTYVCIHIYIYIYIYI